VHFKGPQSESQLRQLYSRAAIYAATSRYEPFGLAPLEAALSRCALVANDIPTFRELWGEAALYFRTNDPGSLNEAITRLYLDPELRMTYAKMAYEHAINRFSADRMVNEYIELYAAVASHRSVAA
jgi:glycosyltransferase involved in cell wall biosynthesis